MRSVIVFRSIVSAVCLACFIAVQSRLAGLFDDELAALVVTSTLATIVTGFVKPALFTPDPRR